MPCVCAQMLRSVWLFAAPCLPGSSIRGTFQERILEQVAISSFRGFSQPRGQTHDSCLGRQMFYQKRHLGSPTYCHGQMLILKINLVPPISWRKIHKKWSNFWLKINFRRQNSYHRAWSQLYPMGLFWRNVSWVIKLSSSLELYKKTKRDQVGFPGGSKVKNSPALQEMQETRWEDPLEEGTATHSNILTTKIPWTKEPDRPWSLEWQGVGHDWSDWAHTAKQGPRDSMLMS